MYLEKRKYKKGTKYYLVHSYREDDKVKKIRRYLGLNLSKEELEKNKKNAEVDISKEIEELNTKIFNFSLSKKQVGLLNNYDNKINIIHLDKEEWKRFTEEFVYNTNAIEGSSVVLDKVKELLDDNKIPEDTDEIETKNVAKAINFIRETKEDLSIELIKKLHKVCFEGSKDFAGNLREVEVVVKNSKGKIIHVGIPVSNLVCELNELVLFYKENKKRFRPLVLAAIIHNQFEYIHPFQDGNGRVGRLLLNFILLKNDYPPINISFKDRKEYYNALEEYSKNQNIRLTLKFLIKQYDKMLRKVTTLNEK